MSGDGWRGRGEGKRYRQGYIVISRDATVRVRSGGGTAFLTIKGARAKNSLARPEYEYEIPSQDAERMLHTLCDGRVVEKTRYRISIGDVVWEVDEFHGKHSGLVIAEIELRYEAQTFDKPEWIGSEVTHDYRYYSGWLAQQK